MAKCCARSERPLSAQRSPMLRGHECACAMVASVSYGLTWIPSVRIKQYDSGRRGDERHRRSAECIAQLQDQLVIDLHKDEERIRDADKAAFDRAMHSCENDGLKAANFGILCDA